MRGQTRVVVTRIARAAIALSVVGAAAVGCGGGDLRAKSGNAGADLVTPLVDAFREEAKGEPARATSMYLDALAVAVDSPGSPWQLTVEQAALDALVGRPVPALEEVGEDTALVYRSRDRSLAAPGERDTIAARLAAIAKKADDPFSVGLVARAMEELAMHRGDVLDAEAWRAARGCAREAAIVGPLDWTAVIGVTAEDPLAAPGAALAASYRGPGAFSPKVAPIKVGGRGCEMDLGAVGANGGVRDVLVDVDVPSAQTIGIAMRAHGAAVLRAGGQLAIERPYELGGDATAQFARVSTSAGTLRLAVRVGMEDTGEDVEIGAWDAHGRPLTMRAPKVGDVGTAKVSEAKALPYPAAKNDAERVALAIGALGAGLGRLAEQTTANEVTRADAPPELLLAYARAVDTARDLDAVHRAERARGAYERVLEAWPTAWEAIVAHAVLAGVRRGQNEARIESLRDLDQHRGKAGASAQPVLDAFDAALSGHERLFDRAKAARDRAAAALPGTALVRDADAAVVPRAGAERVAFACASDSATDRSRLDCYEAIRATGDLAGAGRELDRLRQTMGAPQKYLAVSLRDALSAGDATAATRAYEAMLPGERTLSGLYGAARGAGTEMAPPADAKTREALAALAIVAQDAPGALPPLYRALGDDPTQPFAGIAERITAEDRAKPILPTAATAVLAHTERYDVDANGLARVVLFDVRRVSGTTDVEENAQVDPPSFGGRASMRILRRRIFKKDGRILEPDRTPNASQAHADLAQLEQGDAVEAVYEGFVLPGASGNVTIDTADMLPERTAVHDATIELRVPEGVRSSMWVHPLLGKAAETKADGKRVLTWHLHDVPVRRIEYGAPKMDRDVCVSFSTADWADTARGLRETLASLDEHDPEMARFAREAAHGKTQPREVVSAVVDAVGAAVKEAASSTLSDLELGRAEGAQSVTARGILAEQEGSRTWLIVRTLRELGIPTDVVVAENEPYSANPAFPPHDGRFTHPLAVAHLPASSDGKPSDVWIDADVPGPPLPAGRISPELRGRAAIHADGTITPLPREADVANAERDEIDLRLAVDPKGDAKGSLTILLRGRAAQEIAEVLVRIVGDERMRALRGVVLAWVPFANVDDVALSSSEGSWQVALRAKVSIPAYAQPEGSASAGGARTWVLPGIDPMHYVFPRPYVTTLSATYATRGSRQEALAINRATQYHVHRRVELPPGAQVARVPGPFSLNGPVLGASRAITVNGSVVEEDFGLAVTTGTIPSEGYGDFVASARRTDDAFLASTRVKPAPPPAAKTP